MSPGNEKGWCLVLSGGGAKGVYHVGAWKALRDMGIEIEAVVGNSIGAIIAGFVAQGEFDTLEALLMDQLSIDQFVSIPEELLKDGELHVGLSNYDHLRNLWKDIHEKGGLDTSPLRELLKEHLSEDAIRKSGIDLGVVTVRAKDFAPKEVFLEDMDEGSVLRYLLASASFPGFTTTEIDKSAHIDGGVYDNMPFAMAKSRGYKKIIILDVAGLGRNRKPDVVGTETLYVRCAIKMGGVLDFDPSFLHDFRELGYLDMMKALGQLEGRRYYIEPDDALAGNISEVLSSADDAGAIRELLPQEVRHTRSIPYVMADCAADILKLKRIRRYKFSELLQAIRDAQSEQDGVIGELAAMKIGDVTLKELGKELKSVMKDGRFTDGRTYSPYVLDRALEETFGQHRWARRLPGPSSFIPELKAGRRFLELMQESGLPDDEAPV